MTPLKLLIAGVDRTAWLANGYSIDIEKVLSSETFHLAILDLDSTAGAYRPTVGNDIHLTRTDEVGADIELMFGGEIATVTDEPIIDDTGTVTRIRCRDWMVLADQVFLPPRTFASAPLNEVAAAIYDEYLAPKGVINIGAPTGGPVLPELRIDDFVTSVRQVLDRMTLQAGWPWRINGDKWFAFVDPSSLPGPATLSADGQSVLTDPPLRWEQQVLTHATRVWVQTAVPEAGPGPFEYTEEVTPPSGTSVVPVHVLPTEIRGATTADAASGATSLSLDGLPFDASIRVGARFQIETHTTVYELPGSTTTDADGAATVSLVAGLEKDVPAGTAVTFLRGAFVQLELDDVVTPMDGAPYVWEPIENAIVYPAGDLGGINVRYRTWAHHPTVVREWDPSAQQAIGWFDYATVIDQQITEEEGHTDLATARAFAQAELAKRLTPPKRVTCTTQIPGHYPILLVPMNFPDRLVTGNYFLAETRIRHSTIDETSDAQPLFYELVLWEGDALGESWVQYFRGRNPSQGIRWGPVQADAFVSQAPLEVLFAPAPIVSVAQVPLELLIVPSPLVSVAQVPLELLIAPTPLERRGFAVNAVTAIAGNTITTAAADHVAGNLLVVSTICSHASATQTISDTAGNTWVLQGTSPADGYGDKVRIWTAHNCLGHASNVITSTLSGGATSGYWAMSVQEFTGPWTSAPTIVDVESAVGTGTAIATPTLAVGAGSVLLVAGIAAGGGAGGFTPGSGCTGERFSSGSPGFYFAHEYRWLPSGGDQALSATQGSSDHWGILGVAIRPA